MRKILLSLLFAVACTGLTAQITLTTSDVGAAGTTFHMGVDTVIPPGYLGSGGANQNWDFSTLSVHFYDTIEFVDPAGTPWASDFPNATLAVGQASQGNGYAYLENDPGFLNLLGFAGDPFGLGQSFVLEQNPPLIVVEFPFTYLDSFQDTSTIDITIDASSFGIPFTDSARYKSVVERDLLGDGWGTLNTYAGTYNSLRVKEIAHTKDSVWIRSFGVWTLFQDTMYTDSTFTWWANGEGYFVVEAAYEGPDLVRMTYQDPNPVGIAPGVAAGIRVYPNPAQDRLVLEQETGMDIRFTLLNLQGAVLRQEQLHPGQHEWSLSDLPAGMYLLRSSTAEGEAIHTEKIFITD